MSLLRVDSYALARGDGAAWRTEWCAARRDAAGDWRFGAEAGELLRPNRRADENNEYLETPGPAGNGGAADLDLVYLQGRRFLPEGAGGPIDLVLGGGIDRARTEELLGVLQALGYAPRGVFPNALVAAMVLPPARYGIVELGRSRSWASIVRVGDGRAQLEEVRPYGDFGFCQLFMRWMERAAAAFAAQHRFDVHRKLAANREQLFGQMRAAFAAPPGPVRLSLEDRTVTLDEEAFETHWPAPAFDAEELRLLLLPPLAQTLPLPQGRMGLPSDCENPPHWAFTALADTLPEGGGPCWCAAVAPNPEWPKEGATAS